jgi:hypothetical protein
MLPKVIPATNEADVINRIKFKAEKEIFMTSKEALMPSILINRQINKERNHPIVNAATFLYHLE